MNRPTLIVYRNRKPPTILLVVIIALTFIAIFAMLFTDQISGASTLIGALEGAGFITAIVAATVVFYILTSGRYREKCEIDRLFVGPIWAEWQFAPNELVTQELPTQGVHTLSDPRMTEAQRKFVEQYSAQHTSRSALHYNASTTVPFRLWFGPRGVYHEITGYTPLHNTRSTDIQSIVYQENLVPQEQYHLVVGNAPYGMSRQFASARQTEALGGIKTPKIDFTITVRTKNKRVTRHMYFPVPKGRESEAQGLIQHYQAQ